MRIGPTPPPPPGRSPAFLLGALLGLALGACFVGEGTLGAVCFEDAQCGPGQTCRTGVCGMCKDGEVQAGELCFGPSSEELAFGEVSDLLALDFNLDGTSELVAIVNDDCGVMNGGLSCWDLRVLLPDLEQPGDFETFEYNTMNIPGRVPKAATANFDGNETGDLVLVVVPLDPMADPSQLAVLLDFPNNADSVDVDVVIHARSLETADLDGNGLDDILIGAELASTIVIVPSTGSDFGAQRVIVSDPAPRLAKPVDMDGDGDLDLVIGSAIEGTVGIDLNDGSGNFTPQTRFELPTGLGVNSLATADFDEDGSLDVAALGVTLEGSSTPPSLVVLRGLGNGRLELASELPGGELPIEILADDVTADGHVDILVADLLEDKLPLFINREGSFPDHVSIDVAAGPISLLRGDFDYDAQADLVVGNANGVISVVPSEN